MNTINKFKVKCISTDFIGSEKQDMTGLVTFCDRNGVDFKWVPVRLYIRPKRNFRILAVNQQRGK